MKQCERCKEWQEMGLSDTCPACDMYLEEIESSDPLGKQ